MADSLDQVKALARNYRLWAKASEADGKVDVAKRQTNSANILDVFILELERSRERLRAVGNAYGDLSDLPPEVLAELNVTKLDDLEQQMRDIVASSDSEVGLDTVIIELYRRHKLVHPRRFVMNKLYRMAQKGLISGVEGKKGVYVIPAKKSKLAFDDDLDEDALF